MWSVSEFRSELCGNIIDMMDKTFSLVIFSEAVSGLTVELSAERESCLAVEPSANENAAQNSTDINADLQTLRETIVFRI